MQINIGEAVQLRRGDCLRAMESLPDHSVDLMICDLPYGVLRACKWDTCIDLRVFWLLVQRVLKPRGVVLAFGAQPFTSELLKSNLEWFRYSMVWRKSRPTGFQHCRARPLTSHEDILMFSPANSAAGPQNAANRSAYNPQGLKHLDKPVRRPAGRKVKYMGRTMGASLQEWTNYPRTVLEFESVANPVHNTQKPVDLIRYLIRTYSEPGQVVLDPTMGSGSTGVATIEEGRLFSGIELDPDYFDIALGRIEAALELTRSEGAEVSTVAA